MTDDRAFGADDAAWSPLRRPKTQKTTFSDDRQHLETDAGSVKQLESFHPPRYRLRVGDWRYIFCHAGEDTIEVLRVRNRREAYR